MPTSTPTYSEWLLGKIPDSDLDTRHEQIKVTFPYWQKDIKKDADLLTKVYKYPNRSAMIKDLIKEKKAEYLRQTT